MPKPSAPFELDGASIYPQERDVLSSIITVIYSANPGRRESLVLKDAQETFMQIMSIQDGRWVRRPVFTIGKNGVGPSVYVTSAK